MAYIWEYRRVEYKEDSFLVVIFWFALRFFDYVLIISETSIKPSIKIFFNALHYSSLFPLSIVQSLFGVCLVFLSLLEKH